MMADNRAWLGLGGNIGDVRASMIAALLLLQENTGIDIGKVSSLYETPPWGNISQPAFLNSVAEIRNSLTPLALLDACLEVERKLKRVRNERWGPRTIDIDILVIENLAYRHARLTVPHPQIVDRPFVLVPLAELAPELEIAGKPVQTLADQTDKTGISTIADQDWAEEVFRVEP
jgi:2-amino-4-hydroxy-6-hydroxymethyldihydropteridine diphosphokinase